MYRLLLAVTLLLILPGCAELEFASHVAKSAHSPSQNEGTFKVGNPYLVDGTWYYPKEQYEYTETGIASYYGPGFTGKHTANGEIFDETELTAAHRTLQMPSLVRVTNLDNGRSIIVRVNDRGPYKRGRVMDVSSKAADLLGFKGIGTAKVRLDLLAQESMQIAAAARSGQSTKGYEVLANNGTYAIQPGAVYPSGKAYQIASAQPGPLQDFPAADAEANPTAAIQPVQQETVGAIQSPPSPKTGLSSIVPGHTRYGEFYPDPVVTEMPVKPTNIYIQAGAFAKPENAQHLSAKMGMYGSAKVEQALVNGKQFYRVRIGPMPDVQTADMLLARVVAGGQKQAILIVE